MFYDGFILNMVINSNMDTQHNILYLPSESIISTNGKVSHLLIIMLITLRLQPQQQGRFLPQIPYFYTLFLYLKTDALIFVNKTENHKEDIFV